MRLQVYRYKCGACGDWFEAPEIGELAYGEFLLRSHAGEVRYLNANLDKVFTEVDDLLGSDPRLCSFDQFQRADVLNEVFGVACDPDSTGGLFRVAAKPLCPKCNQCNISEWESTEPPCYVDVDVIEVAHSRWESLSEGEKQNRIREALDSSPLVWKTEKGQA